MKKMLTLFLFVLSAMILITGCGTTTKADAPTQSALSDGKNCMACHTSRDLILADLKANPLPKVEKSAETSGEG
ncbi:MAG TPA: hypothetical protein VHS59_00235 [Bacillota bacterium]|nr:hypothetical protein [Bacillota bacterium]